MKKKNEENKKTQFGIGISDLDRLEAGIRKKKVMKPADNKSSFIYSNLILLRLSVSITESNFQPFYPKTPSPGPRLKKPSHSGRLLYGFIDIYGNRGSGSRGSIGTRTFGLQYPVLTSHLPLTHI